MVRRKSGRKSTRSQGEADLAQRLKQIEKQKRELLKKAGKDIREVRREVSALKKAGIVSKRIETRKYLPSKYMMKKIARNRDILSGEMIAVKAPKKVRQLYEEKGLFERRGEALIVPREDESQRVRIQRGLVEVTRQLKGGEERRVILPFHVTDMEQVAERLKTDPTLDGMKEADEAFGFRLFGHNMRTFGFPDAETLGQYISERYQHLFKGKSRHEAMQHFVLLRYKPDYNRSTSGMKEGPRSQKVYGGKREKRLSAADVAHKERMKEKRRLSDKLRKRAERSKEDETQHKLRIEKQRIISRNNRQSKYAAKIERLHRLD